MKRYTIYKFPSYYGTPKSFRFKISARIYSIIQTYNCLVCDLKDNKTGEYIPFWPR